MSLIKSGRASWSRALVALGLVVPAFTLAAAQAYAQAMPPSPPGGAAPAPGGGAPAPGGGAPAPAPGAPTVTQVSPGTTTQFFPGGVAPVPPGGTLGGGNAQFSSSKPITGNERDGFDFRSGGAGSGSVHGDPNGSFIIGQGGDRGPRPGVVPNAHSVRKGDTLWDICGFYFQNPYQWPRIWSFNPQIQNPHWIFPGDLVKLKNGAAVADQPQAPSSGQRLTDRRRQVPVDTVFLRNEGFIEDESSNWGELNGAREDKIFLTDFDEVYLRLGSEHEVKVGQELTVYRPVKNVGRGKLIEIQGTVKVDQWNAKDHVARARVTETLDTIERGARIGPISRRFEVVPPLRNEQDIEATVLTSVHPHNFYGANQVVFLDKGEEEGLKAGNRLFIIRKGDGFHKTQPQGNAAKRIALEDESPAAVESIAAPRNDSVLPEEVLAELRIVNAAKHTAMALVTTSRREIEQGDHAYARKGY
jgi:hypothetical protein